MDDELTQLQEHATKVGGIMIIGLSGPKRLALALFWRLPHAVHHGVIWLTGFRIFGIYGTDIGLVGYGLTNLAMEET